MNQNNEYFVGLDKEKLLTKNVVVAKNINGKLSILIKSTISENMSNIFSTDFMQLKTCSKIFLDNVFIGLYHIVVCLSEDVDIINEFCKVFDLLILKNPKKMSSKDVLDLFNSIDLIFKTTVEKENRELQIGLYGELITLKYLYKRGYINILEKWHSNFFSKHDIELDKSNRIEIKTTVKEERIHSFKHNQLTRKDVNVYVVSCMLEYSEEGLSLFDLIAQIMDICNDYKKINSLQILKKKCGIDSNNKGLIFNENFSYLKIKLFDSRCIPQIKEEIPETITHVSYDVNLSSVNEMSFEKISHLL